MKSYFLLMLLASTVLAVNWNSQQRETPLDICGRAEDMKCISGGVLNGKILSTDLLACPQKAQEKPIEGTVMVMVQLLFNEDGEVISATPISGPEELWAPAIKATVKTRFNPTKLSGKPIKVRGVLYVDFKNGKIDIPISKGTAPVIGPNPIPRP